MSGAGAYAVVAGGGTAGHVVPGLAIAENSFVAAFHAAGSYVGSSRGIETRLVSTRFLSRCCRVAAFNGG